ncbi:MAG: hypothetical protein AAGA81_12325 [Acidobacteriota bacterium]
MTERLWRLRLRDRLTSLLLVLVVVLFALFAAVTATPEAPVWERIEQVPGLGQAVARLRERYLPPDADGSSPSPRRASAKPRGERPEPPPDTEFVGIGARFLAEPRSDAELIRVTESLGQFEALERQGRWVRLVLQRVDDEAVTAWLDTEAERDMSEPPLGNAPEPPRPRPASPATRAQIDAVMKHLEQPIEQLSVAGYSVLLGLRDPVLVGMLRAELPRLEAAYRSRYRLQPLGDAAETIVVFREEESYRGFQDTAPRIAGLQSAGHSMRGLVALFKGDRPYGDVRDTLRHEITHLLNRRALGPALPPWLDEGLADEFALLSATQGDDPFSAYRFTLGNETLYRGPLASLRILLQTRDGGRWLSLERLLGMDWDQFVRGGQGAMRYAQSSLFVHWLLEAYPEEFHRYLNSVSLGRPAGAAELSRACGREIRELDEQFQRWLERWRGAAGLL